jgi:cyclin-dependent kinase regulatory subunit CKS1
MPHNNIQYSDKYYDDLYEYRCVSNKFQKARAFCAFFPLTSFLSSFSHVILPPEIAKVLPKGKLMSEAEWRGLGVQQSRGWVHYAIHKPEPHVLLFRRPRTDIAQPAGVEISAQNM